MKLSEATPAPRAPLAPTAPLASPLPAGRDGRPPPPPRSAERSRPRHTRAAALPSYRRVKAATQPLRADFAAGAGSQSTLLPQLLPAAKRTPGLHKALATTHQPRADFPFDICTGPALPLRGGEGARRCRGRSHKHRQRYFRRKKAKPNPSRTCQKAAPTRETAGTRTTPRGCQHFS